MSRPTKFRAEFVAMAEELCRRGATDPELAAAFGVSLTTIKTWKGEHPEFLAALKVGKEAADERVVRSLYQRAVGYTAPEDKISVVDGQLVVTPTLKHYPPDTTAAIFWLKNRDPERWRDRQEIETTTITIQRSYGGQDE